MLGENCLEVGHTLTDNASASLSSLKFKSLASYAVVLTPFLDCIGNTRVCVTYLRKNACKLGVSLVIYEQQSSSNHIYHLVISINNNRFISLLNSECSGRSVILTS